MSVASQMATYLGKALNRAQNGSEAISGSGFNWNNKGSMVFIGNGNVRPLRLPHNKERVA
jgi:hypothetical protein